MLPAPASIAAPLTTNSRPSWSPAVPPPPVCGAAVGDEGLGLAAGLGAGDRVGLGDADGRGEGLALALGVLLLVAVLLNVTDGGRWVGCDVAEPSPQPATATQVRMAKTPKPMTVSFALSTVPAITRTVM